MRAMTPWNARGWTRRLLAIVVALMLVHPVAAQKRKTKRTRAKTHKSSHGTSPSVAGGASGAGRAGRAGSAGSAGGTHGAGGEVTEENGKKVKVIRFTGLDISGKLKSPQMLYFLNRMNAEFDRPRLPHRSFVGEIESSTSKKPLK